MSALERVLRRWREDTRPRVVHLPLPVPDELLGFHFNELPMAIVVRR